MEHGRNERRVVSPQIDHFSTSKSGIFFWRLTLSLGKWYMMQHTWSSEELKPSFPVSRVCLKNAQTPFLSVFMKVRILEKFYLYYVNIKCNVIS